MSLKTECYGVFDFDGTILDSIYNPNYGCSREFVDILVKEYGISEELQQKALDYYLGAGGGVQVEVQYPECLKLLNLPQEKAEELAQRYLTAIHSKIYPLYGDVEACMKTMLKSGFGFNCVSTSMKQQHLEKTLKHYSLDKYFSFWIGGGNAVVSKSEHLKIIVKKFEIGEKHFRERAYYVGDSFRDMDIAANMWKVRFPVYVNRRNLDFGKIKNGLEDKHVNPSDIVVISSLAELPDKVLSWQL